MLPSACRAAVGTVVLPAVLLRVLVLLLRWAVVVAVLAPARRAVLGSEPVEALAVLLAWPREHLHVCESDRRQETATSQQHAHN